MTLKSISILHDERISTTVTVALPLVRILAIHYKYLLNVCYVPDTILGPGDTAVNKTAKSPALGDLCSSGGGGGQTNT